MWPKQFRPWKQVSNIVVVGVLTLSALRHSDLKAAQMNMQHCLIQELMLYDYKLHITLWKQSKTFVVQKVKAQLITVW